MTKPSYTEAPFDENGNLLSYPRAWFGKEVVWNPIEPFVESLKLVGTERGRSAAHFMWEDTRGRQYPMFLTDLVNLLIRRPITPPGVTHYETWTIKKRGQNYGIALA
jgi:hypothetical protein